MCKTSKNERKNNVLQNLALEFENKCSDELIHSMLSLNSYLPGVSHLISPIMEAADKLQKKCIDTGLIKVRSSKGGYGVIRFVSMHQLNYSTLSWIVHILTSVYQNKLLECITKFHFYFN